MRLYRWNTATCAAFYGPLQDIEVALRNAMHRELAACYGKEWYDNPAAGLDWGARKRIADARRTALRAGHAVTPPRMVATLLASSRIRRILEFRRPQDVVVAPASSDEQRARVLTGVKALRFAPPPLRGASGPDAGSAHARPDWLLLTMPAHTTPTCCGRPSAPE